MGERKRRMHRWTNEEKEYLKELSDKCTTSETAKIMSDKFNYKFTREQIKATKYRLGMRSNSGIVVGIKGRPPFNKGMKQSEFMNEYSIENSKKTRFKKGHEGYGGKKIGSEKKDKDGYTLIKVDKRNWELKHRYMWKREYGEIPENSVITFADKNRSNVSLDNLLMITRSEMLVMNTKKLFFENKELTKTGVAMANLYLKMSECNKKLKK